MSVNIYTKFDEGLPFYDLCKNIDVREDVRAFYNKYKGRCEQYLSSVFTADNINRKHYVYAWYAKTDPKRYFYVGKGTSHRYDHILYEIKKYKNGFHNSRFRRYSEIQDKWGIDYEIIISDLTDYEALIYEQCLKLHYLDNGEVLLNVEGIPSESLAGDWGNDEASANSPQIIKDNYYQRYLDDYHTPYFDDVTEELLMRTHLYPYFIDFSDQGVIQDKQLIVKWLQDKNAKIYRTVSKNTDSVIVQGLLMYDKYLDYRNNGKKIFSSKEVIEYIL